MIGCKFGSSWCYSCLFNTPELHDRSSKIGAEIKCKTHSIVLMQGMSLPLEEDGVFSKLLDAFPKQNTTLLPSGDIFASVLCV